MADIYALEEGAAPGASVMYGVALAGSSGGSVLVRLDDPVTVPFDEEPGDVVAVDLSDDMEGSVGEVGDDAAALEPGDYDADGAVDADETSEADSEGGEAEEATEPDDPQDDGYDELTVETEA